MPATDKDKIDVENVNVPGQVTRVDAAKYQAMKQAMLAVLPRTPPGLTHKQQIMTAVKPVINQDLFPDGQKTGWWSKSVQLDLEAKGQLIREDSKPLRWYRK